MSMPIVSIDRLLARESQKDKTSTAEEMKNRVNLGANGTLQKARQGPASSGIDIKGGGGLSTWCTSRGKRDGSRGGAVAGVRGVLLRVGVCVGVGKWGRESRDQPQRGIRLIEQYARHKTRKQVEKKANLRFIKVIIFITINQKKKRRRACKETDSGRTCSKAHAPAPPHQPYCSKRPRHLAVGGKG